MSLMSFTSCYTVWAHLPAVFFVIIIIIFNFELYRLCEKIPVGKFGYATI